jgi:nascent polypeptide-associated complex subunit alpha
MIPGMNPRQMKQAMKRMGIEQQDLQAQEVIIRLADRDLVITNPEVAKVNMMGQETYQVVGEVEERARDSAPDINEEDILTVMQQTGAEKPEATKAIQEADGDLAAAIMALTGDDDE